MNYCKLVRGFQLMCQHSITVQHIREAQELLCTWEYEFEHLYYRRRQDRIHFIRPCIHQTNHLVAETVQKGPPICYAQWTMERTIGNLGQEIRQPARPYANLSQEGVRRCQVNTLLSIMPELDEPAKLLPAGAVDLGDGFALLRKRDKYTFSPVGGAAQAILDYLGDGRPLPRIKRWARLLLPNGQIARSLWREMFKPLDQTRMSRNVKVSITEHNICTLLTRHSYSTVNRCGLVKFYTLPGCRFKQTSTTSMTGAGRMSRWSNYFPFQTQISFGSPHTPLFLAPNSKKSV
jgi:hypothetical protein